MIRKMESMIEVSKSGIVPFCRPNALGVKALGPVLAYGTNFPIVQTFAQRNENEELTAVIVRFQDNVVICSAESMEEDLVLEIREFLDYVGYASILADPSLFGTEPTGLIMTWDSEADCRLKRAVPEPAFIVNKELREIYDLLVLSNPGYFMPDYSAWYNDINFRIWHQSAGSILIRDQGKPVASAMALTSMQAEIFIGAVAADPSERGKHFASEALYRLVEQYPNHKYFLFCLPDMQAFYEHLGMRVCGAFSELNEQGQPSFR